MPGSRINEDGSGLHGRHAWIIDGATGVLPQRLTPGASDAAWLVEAIGQRLGNLAASEHPSHEILGHLEAHIGPAFDGAVERPSDIPDDYAPSACLGIIGISGGAEFGRLRIAGGFLGDVVALVPSAGGVLRWTDERAKPFERRTLAALSAAAREPGKVPEAVRLQILENRTMLNRPEGYWVVNPRRPWAGREVWFEADLEAGRPVVLATDGFMRLVDVFRAYSEASLHAALAAGRGDNLIQELRELERGDPMAEAHPRVKTHDDATVLVIAAEP